jgi:riboflavin biosynthesis pyrimidine reductase
VRIENYSGAQLPVAARQARQRRGQAEVPPIAVVTRSGDLDPSALLFTRTEVPPLILTCSRTFHDTRRRLGSVAEVIDASGPQSDSVDGATVLTILAGRGLFRILAEGGPLFLGLLIGDDLLDELCLTIAPILVGGASKRIVTGVGHVHTKMRRAHLLADDEGYLYTRYVKGG